MPIEGQLVVRRLSVKDVDVYRRLRLEALTHDPLSYASVFADWAHLTDRQWRQHLSEPVFAAFLDGKAVGLMALRFERARKMVHRAKLMSVYVRKGQRGTGVAGNLLQKVIEHALAHGIIQLELAVGAANLAAVGFYERHGFIEVGRIPDGFLGHDTKHDELIMVLRLAPPFGPGQGVLVAPYRENGNRTLP